jgi:hypothetical protein
MKRILILIIFNIISFKQIFARDMVYIPEDWRVDESIGFFEILYMWYDKNGDYVILIDNNDSMWVDFQFAKVKYRFLEIRGIDPKTVKIQKVSGNWAMYIGKFKENYDCSKFELKGYEYYFKDINESANIKPQNACVGYKDYSYKDLQEMGIIINTIDFMDLHKKFKL